MALIHNELYHSKDLARIDFAEYIHTLTSHLFRSYGIRPGTISLTLDVENILLSVDTAIPCGLIINELVSNSLKYAFNGKQEGALRISLHSGKMIGFPSSSATTALACPRAYISKMQKRWDCVSSLP